MVIVIYHRADLDGIGSAAVVYNYFLDNNPYSMPTFIGFDYKDDPYEVIKQIPDDARVYFVDCCFEDTNALLLLKDKSCHVHVLDHHYSNVLICSELSKTHEFSCSDIDLENAKNNTNSGIFLVWKKFYPERPVPDVVTLISKYDTWKHNNDPEIVDFYIGLNHHIYNQRYGYKNELWRLLFHNDITRVANITSNGKTIREYSDRQNYNFCLEGAIEIDILGKKGIAVNTPFRGSQNIQGIDKSKYDFLMVFVFLGDIWRYSIYTENTNTDAAALAKHFQGGGHRGAAGFQTKTLIDEVAKGIKWKPKS
jgi:oligoribonuclease NrnB/cAMP/cGMP phosphodiesterase (DHH superfamily)